jgi:hypothetical protein
MLSAAKKQQSERVVFDVSKEEEGSVEAGEASVNDNTVTSFDSSFSDEDPWLRRKNEEVSQSEKLDEQSE